MRRSSKTSHVRGSSIYTPSVRRLARAASHAKCAGPQGKIAMHQRVGNFGIAYGCLVFALGAIVRYSGRRLPHRGRRVDTRARGGTGRLGSSRHSSFRRILRRRSRVPTQAGDAQAADASCDRRANACRRRTGYGSSGTPPNVLSRSPCGTRAVLLGIVYDYVTRRRVHPVLLDRSSRDQGHSFRDHPDR